MSKHQFLIVLPRWYPVWGEPVPRDGFLEVEIRRGNLHQVARVESEVLPEAFSALVLLKSVTGETERERRYIVVASAYEAVVEKRELDLVAIRHALAHPPDALGDVRVVDSLRARFNGVHLDLSQYAHRKEFFRCLGQMLIAIDRALFNTLESAGQPVG